MEFLDFLFTDGHLFRCFGPCPFDHLSSDIIHLMSQALDHPSVGLSGQKGPLFCLVMEGDSAFQRSASLAQFLVLPLSRCLVSFHPLDLLGHLSLQLEHFPAIGPPRLAWTATAPPRGSGGAELAHLAPPRPSWPCMRWPRSARVLAVLYWGGRLEGSLLRSGP